jgi:hypothetical protein
VLYAGGKLFARRRCYGLAYASQQETPMYRGVGRSQKIRLKLDGSPDLLEPFPDKPKGMHWRTYAQLRAQAEAGLAVNELLAPSWMPGSIDGPNRTVVLK